MPETSSPHIISAQGGPEGIPAKIQIPAPDMTVAEMKLVPPAVKPILPEAVLPDVGPPKQVIVADSAGRPDWEAMADRSQDVAEVLGKLCRYNDYGIQTSDRTQMLQDVLKKLADVPDKQIDQYEALYGRAKEILAVTSARNESLGLPYGPNSEREFLVEVALKLKNHTFLYEAVGLVQKGLLDTSSGVAMKDHRNCANLLLKIADAIDDPFIRGRAERALSSYIADTSPSSIGNTTQNEVLDLYRDSLIQRQANYRAESLMGILYRKAENIPSDTTRFSQSEPYFQIYSTIKALGEALPEVRHTAVSYLLGFVESKSIVTNDIPYYHLSPFIENATVLIKRLDPAKKLGFVKRFADMLGTNCYKYEGNVFNITQALTDVAISEGDQVDAKNAVVSEVYRVLHDRAIPDVDLSRTNMIGYQRERVESARIALGKLEYRYPFLKAVQDVPVAAPAGETVDART